MIFLFRDHSYKVYHPMASESKVLKKFKKKKEEIVAVLIDTATKLHSDTYTIITSDRFKTEIEPFQITYSIGLAGIDDPIERENTLTRTMKIESVMQYYNLCALLQMMANSETAGDFYSLGEQRAILVAIRLKMGNDEFAWDPSKESAEQFLKRQDMTCDTDIFLDASTGSKRNMVDEGCYITRYDPLTGDSNLRYYYHGKKALIWFKKDRWFLFSDNVVPSMDINLPDDECTGFFAICINQTSMVYIASYPFLYNYREIQECTVNVHYGHWETITQEDTGMTYTQAVKDGGVKGYVAYNGVDVMYMALYLPQYWDIIRYLCGETPVLVQFEVIQKKLFHKTGNYKVPPVAKDQGLDIDLLAIMSGVCTLPSRCISFTD